MDSQNNKLATFIGVAICGISILATNPVMAAVTVCAPPECAVPVLEAPIAAHASFQIGAMIISLLAAWLIVSGLFMLIGFFPRRRCSTPLSLDQEAIKQWESMQDIMRQDAQQWNSTPELIQARKTMGVRMMVIGLVLASGAIAWERSETINPTGVTAEVHEKDGRVWRVEFRDDGNALIAGRDGHWNALQDRIILRDEKMTATCWLWNSDYNGLWRFEPEVAPPQKNRAPQKNRTPLNAKTAHTGSPLFSNQTEPMVKNDCPSIGSQPLPDANMRILSAPAPLRGKERKTGLFET